MLSFFFSKKFALVKMKKNVECLVGTKIGVRVLLVADFLQEKFLARTISPEEASAGGGVKR
jgi:hypothetical protein